MFNEKQTKILNKIFDVGIDNFESERGLTTEKYVVTKVSKLTASRDVTELIEIGCIKQIIGSRERDKRYRYTIKI